MVLTTFIFNFYLLQIKTVIINFGPIGGLFLLINEQKEYHLTKFI